MRQVACPNCGRMALLADERPGRCLYCGADLPPAPPDQPAGTMPGAQAPQPLAPQQAPGAPPPGVSGPPATTGIAMPPAYPPYFPPAGYGQVPPGYGPPPPSYGQVPPGYPQMPPGVPGGMPVDPRMQQSAPGYPYGYPAPGPGASYPYPYTGPAPYGYAGAPMAQPAAPAKPRRRWLLVTAIVLLVVLLLGAGGTFAVIAAQQNQQNGQSSTPTATPVPTVAVTAPSGFTAYQDPTGIYGLAVPSGWQQLNSSSGGYTTAQFADATQHTSITVEYTDTSSLNEQQFDDQFLKQLTASLPGATLTNKKTLPQIYTGSSLDSATWASEGADLTFTSGGSTSATLHAVVQTASRTVQQDNGPNDFLFATLFVAPSDTFDAVNTRYFQPAQQSFAFRP